MKYKIGQKVRLTKNNHRGYPIDRDYIIIGISYEYYLLFTENYDGINNTNITSNIIENWHVNEKYLNKQCPFFGNLEVDIDYVIKEKCEKCSGK